MTQSIILACGNPLRGDDGAALQIACNLQEGYAEPETEIRCAQQWTPELAESISHSELAIFVDASATIPAGHLQLQKITCGPAKTRVITHSMDPCTLLGLARELFGAAPCRAFLLTIGAETFELGEGLSPAVKHAVPAAMDQIKALLSGVRLPEGEALPPAVNYWNREWLRTCDLSRDWAVISYQFSVISKGKAVRFGGGSRVARGM